MFSACMRASCQEPRRLLSLILACGTGQCGYYDGGHMGWDGRWLESYHRMTEITFLFSSFWKSLYPYGRKTDGGTVKKVVLVSAEHKRMHPDSKPQLWINWQIYLLAYQGQKTIILGGKWKWHCVAHSHSFVNCSWNGCEIIREELAL